MKSTIIVMLLLSVYFYSKANSEDGVKTSPVLLQSIINTNVSYSIDLHKNPPKVSVERFKQDDVHCITEAVYRESRGESEKVQKLVALVIMNRIAHPHYPDTPCSVVNQKAQFSYHKTVKDKRILEPKAWKKAEVIAVQALSGEFDNWGTSTHFVECDHDVSWRNALQYRGKFGKLCFYADNKRV
jgi:spore germination cell wall hydrolase CwlJ-like protein